MNRKNKDTMYQHAKIYVIRSYQTDDLYIGSTCNMLSKRLSCHKSKYKLYLNRKHHYVTAFDIIKYGDAYIELLESYPCKNNEELLAREGYWIRKNEKSINKCIAGRTDKQYYEDNKKELCQYQKQYRNNNKDKVNEYQKQYREDNKEKIYENVKKYQEINKEKIQNWQKSKQQCDCGCWYTLRNKARHMKSSKHNEKLNL